MCRAPRLELMDFILRVGRNGSTLFERRRRSFSSGANSQGFLDTRNDIEGGFAYSRWGMNRSGDIGLLDCFAGRVFRQRLFLRRPLSSEISTSCSTCSIDGRLLGMRPVWRLLILLSGVSQTSPVSTDVFQNGRHECTLPSGEGESPVSDIGVAGPYSSSLELSHVSSGGVEGLIGVSKARSSLE